MMFLLHFWQHMNSKDVHGNFIYIYIYFYNGMFSRKHGNEGRGRRLEVLVHLELEILGAVLQTRHNRSLLIVTNPSLKEVSFPSAESKKNRSISSIVILRLSEL